MWRIKLTAYRKSLVTIEIRKKPSRELPALINLCTVHEITNTVSEECKFWVFIKKPPTKSQLLLIDVLKLYGIDEVRSIVDTVYISVHYLHYLYYFLSERCR